MFDFDLADRVDDLICTFEGGTDSDMDMVSMIVTGWIVFMLTSFVGTRFLYRKFKGTGSGSTAIDSADKDKVKDKLKVPLQSNSVTEKTKANRNISTVPLNNGSANKRAGASVSEKSQDQVEAKPKSTKGPKVELNPPIPKCTGPDPLLVAYVTQCHGWYGEEVKGGRELEEVKDSYVDALNKSLRGSLRDVKHKTSNIYMSSINQYTRVSA